MYKLALMILSAATITLSLPASANDDGQEGEWTQLRARYLIHSGSATYPEAPTKMDRVLTVVIEGKAAKEIFDLIGPNASPQCSPDKRDKERRKKGVECIYTAQLDDPKDFHYRCWIGIDLRTGDGDARIAC
ncbi:hypothetical protein MJ904_01960 [Massilia sp. MB5]|uniref:hypothetical protein n=1 Tax=unclassified Massilia TaxID=2609279 RepID=UPI000A913BC5|nr:MULTISPECIES: hypothetical protein [unclassified Massilia]UMR31052.1 hypothetical protein MJ904_01960 [Massilia sp. MB5]